jgi:hypothetical protein
LTRLAEWEREALIQENQRLHREVERLRALLHRHGIEPESGTTQTG